jgi:N-methylhydantoinase A
VIEVFNWTVQIAHQGKLCDPSNYRYANAATATRKIKATRQIIDCITGEMADAAVYDRYALEPGDCVEGGALVEENDTTIYLPLFTRAVVTESFDIVAEIQSGR